MICLVFSMTNVSACLFLYKLRLGMLIVLQCTRARTQRCASACKYQGSEYLSTYIHTHVTTCVCTCMPMYVYMCMHN